MRRKLATLILITATSAAWSQTTTTPAVKAAANREFQQRARKLTARGAQYLLAAQEKDGGWFSEQSPGISCLVLKALIQEPTVGPNHAAVRRGVRRVLQFQHEDGAIFAAEGLHKNYESAVALSMFAVLDRPEYRKQVAALQKYLKGLQWDESEDKSTDDPWYGGAGYGRHKRPDLSNTQMMLDALHDSGLPASDPAYQKALLFVQRCQMVGETNDQPFARGSAQGGFIYSPANGGESKAGYQDVAGRRELRCYGSMSYAGFKSMLYAGLKPDDPRVQAVLTWIQRYWTLEHNPNMPERQTQEGLYYYFHVLARTLRVWNHDVIADSRGQAHNWRHELTARLAGLQQKDGSWVNAADRYMEGLPALATAYSLLALQEAYPAAPK